MIIRFWMIIFIAILNSVILFSYPTGAIMLRSSHKKSKQDNLLRNAQEKIEDLTKQVKKFLVIHNNKRLTNTRKNKNCKRSTSNNYIEEYRKPKFRFIYKEPNNINTYKSTAKILNTSKATTKILNTTLCSKITSSYVDSTIANYQQLFVNDATTKKSFGANLKKYATKTKNKVKSIFHHKTVTESSIKKDIFKYIFGTTKSLGGKTKINVKRFYMPVMVAADKTFVDFHRELDYEIYILTAMNMVADYFVDTTLGFEIYVTVQKIMYLDQESENFNDSQAFVVLRKFCAWANKVKPDTRHPEYYDVAILITRQELLGYEDPTAKIFGATYSASACLPCKACIVVRDTGLLLGVNIAHQLGHLLGLSEDDGENERCPSEASDSLKVDLQYHHIMSSHLEQERLVWSECSRVAITNFFSEGLGSCLEDEPPQTFHRFPDILPGVMYTADMQCELIYKGSKSCYMNQEEFCQHLFCGFGNGTCFSYDVEPAQGTSCGINKWCFNLECVHLGHRPGAVNGVWGPWNKWGPCSRTCGGGVQITRRVCNNPPPSFGGHHCPGPSHRERMCNVQPCDPREPSFRAIQCANFNKIPISGSFHKWRPVLRPILRDRCSLYCVNQENVTARLEPMVEDGTPCRAGSNDVCVDGHCKAVGCDWVLNSGTVEDRCGVCGGAGDSCVHVSEIYNHSSCLENQNNSNILITKIPNWSTKIRIYQMNPTTSCLAISMIDRNNSEIFLIGGSSERCSGEFFMGSKVGYYTFLQNSRVYIIIKGPIPYDINLYAIRCTTISPIHYSYMRFSKKPRNILHYKRFVHVDNHNFDWEYLDWTPCSARCEGGTERCKARCVSLSSGLVDDYYCTNLIRPPDKIRVCNIQRCSVSWHVGPWMGDPKYRTVLCMREARLWYESDVIVDPRLCDSPPPVTVTDQDILEGNQVFDVRKVQQTTKYYFGAVEPLNRDKSPTNCFNIHLTTNHDSGCTTEKSHETNCETANNNTNNGENGKLIITEENPCTEENNQTNCEAIKLYNIPTNKSINIINNITTEKLGTVEITTKHTSTNAKVTNELHCTEKVKSTTQNYHNANTTKALFRNETISKYSKIKTSISQKNKNNWFNKLKLIPKRKSTTESYILNNNDSSISIDDFYLVSTLPYLLDVYNDFDTTLDQNRSVVKDFKNQTQLPAYTLNEKMTDLIERINSIRTEINKDKIRVEKMKKKQKNDIKNIKSKAKKSKRSIYNDQLIEKSNLHTKLKYKENLSLYSARYLRTKNKEVLLIVPNKILKESVFIVMKSTLGKYLIDFLKKMTNFTISFGKVTYNINKTFNHINDHVEMFIKTLSNIFDNQNYTERAITRKRDKKLFKQQNTKRKYNWKLNIGKKIIGIFGKRKNKSCRALSFEFVDTLKKTDSKKILTLHTLRNYNRVLVLNDKYNINKVNSYIILHVNTDINFNTIIKSNKSQFIISHKIIEIQKGGTLHNINDFLRDVINVVIQNKKYYNEHKNQNKFKNIIIIEPKNVNNYFVFRKHNEENKLNLIPTGNTNIKVYESTTSLNKKKIRRKRNPHIKRSKSNRKISKSKITENKFNIIDRKKFKSESRITKELRGPKCSCRFNYIEDKFSEEKKMDPNLNVIVSIVCGNNLVHCLSENIYREIGDELPFLYKTIKP